MMPISVDIQVGLTSFGVFVFAVSLVGNCLVIHIVRTRRHMRGTTNILISNMSIADLMITFVFPYLIKYYFAGARWFGGIMGTITCKLIHSMQMISIFCSIYTLLVISVDRFLAVMLPMKKFFTTQVTKWSVALIWIASIGFSIPLAISASVVNIQGYHLCIELWNGVGLSSHNYIIAFTTLTYAVPLVFISFAYGTSGYKLWGSTPPGQQNSITRRNNRSIIESRRNATKMLITVVVLFAVCWLPFQVRELIRAEAPNVSQAIPLNVDLVLPWFGFVNSALNPIIYIIFSATFRREFQKLLFFWKPYTMLDAGSSPGSPSLASRYTTKKGKLGTMNGRKATLRNDCTSV